MFYRAILLCGLCWLACVNLSFANTNFVNRPAVQSFMNKMVKKHHFQQQELITLFNAVKVRPQVMQFLKKPNEKKPWYSYQKLFLTEWRVRKGVEFWNRYQDALTRAEQIYGVPASIIVATIGIETKYGVNTGDFRVLDALSNIAFSDSPRAGYFRDELEQFLLLTRERHLDPLKVMGSYAGAIGQPQFMPSSYRNYAVNFSGIPPIDLSHNEVDVIGSIANYYQKHGWKTNQPIVVSAQIRGNQYTRLLNPDNNHKTVSLTELNSYGITPTYTISNQEKIKLIMLEGFWGNEYWLGLHNFDVIKRYNTSDLYAMAVYQLSEYISDLRRKTF